VFRDDFLQRAHAYELRAGMGAFTCVRPIRTWSRTETVVSIPALDHVLPAGDRGDEDDSTGQLTSCGSGLVRNTIGESRLRDAPSSPGQAPYRAEGQRRLARQPYATPGFHQDDVSGTSRRPKICSSSSLARQIEYGASSDYRKRWGCLYIGTRALTATEVGSGRDFEGRGGRWPSRARGAGAGAPRAQPGERAGC